MLRLRLKQKKTQARHKSNQRSQTCTALSPESRRISSQLDTLSNTQQDLNHKKREVKTQINRLNSQLNNLQDSKKRGFDQITQLTRKQDCAYMFLCIYTYYKECRVRSSHTTCIHVHVYLK